MFHTQAPNTIGFKYSARFRYRFENKGLHNTVLVTQLDPGFGCPYHRRSIEPQKAVRHSRPIALPGHADAECGVLQTPYARNSESDFARQAESAFCTFPYRISSPGECPYLHF